MNNRQKHKGQQERKRQHDQESADLLAVPSLRCELGDEWVVASCYLHIRQIRGSYGIEISLRQVEFRRVRKPGGNPVGQLTRHIGRRNDTSSKLVDRRKAGFGAQCPKLPRFQRRADRSVSQSGGRGREIQQLLGDRTPADFPFSTRQVEAVNRPRPTFVG
ncbi:MAG TPA: hypothetical protein VNO18_25010 [Xanthobacteraceae bacterium]|nr:hypothetical protein [Xanthobacteraceae bacterium]